jgi:hypothetical protein
MTDYLFLFGLSFAIGLVFFYLFKSDTKRVIIYPDFDNIDKITFVDDKNKLYKYEIKINE